MRCAACGYAANVEAAVRQRNSTPPRRPGRPGSPTPGRRSTTMLDSAGIDAVVELFADQGLTAADMLKCLAVMDPEDRPAVILVPGDREVRLPHGSMN